MSNGGGSVTTWVVGGCVAAVLMPVVMMVAVSGGGDAEAEEQGVGGGLKSGQVPAEYVPWVLKAGAMCDVIKPAVIAAQIEAESGWNPNAKSPVGAEGLSQFMPGTWPSWGKDDDGNGRVSPYDPGDAIMAQGRYDCALAKQVQGYKDSGQATGETLDLALAAYNAGPGAVQQYGGIPPYTETQNYVTRIKSLISKYESVDDPPGKLPAGRQMAMPLSGNPPVTSPYGWRMHPTLGVRKLHTGTDFGAGSGTPVLAARDGVVTFAGWSNGYGNRVVISHGTIDGDTISTTYNHMLSGLSVGVGDQVKVGQRVGLVGSTGYSTGAHLHFEVQQNGAYVNPAPWLGL
ncbi:MULTISPECIES: peptidoglycan DD-metalloendopeptidase family protein [Streptomyces]|uniref:Peptidoglycan DD-metalloendopeptidase family protein n=1 Tax=Streptomyces caniscabiei TaxID=2746961 RepID=A0ABU4MHL3_9ACTN|nr:MULTISPECIES: peptidoglycan DD-metalloendopeptidase family protein [Streptomyces]MBE4736951.1 peptidoglycan DD-metalloendopeptidase family protein [Streptomyces caniscabiei]MBE4757813.1 peptidoglycan DD-metalloendopeptidase family protein [Streptomyces caniscabiei]MBE4770795.1 peptidoglycan DD-metalloendopeptidase family protein [Streptomyces caniscabiei]MBE4786932.1 peptidoglycan DD-metalloendopeptidase family protein [Streptomyces caniscabiei]MBE4794814.1 peptidoglycan DD-metalloendopepti